MFKYCFFYFRNSNTMENNVACLEIIPEFNGITETDDSKEACSKGMRKL